MVWHELSTYTETNFPTGIKSQILTIYCTYNIATTTSDSICPTFSKFQFKCTTCSYYPKIDTNITFHRFISILYIPLWLFISFKSWKIFWKGFCQRNLLSKIYLTIIIDQMKGREVGIKITAKIWFEGMYNLYVVFHLTV